jgi:hypothetical protein
MRATDGNEISPATNPELLKQWPNMVLPEFPWTIFTIRNFGIPILMMRLLRRNVRRNGRVPTPYGNLGAIRNASQALAGL